MVNYLLPQIPTSDIILALLFILKNVYLLPMKLWHSGLCYSLIPFVTGYVPWEADSGHLWNVLEISISGKIEEDWAEKMSLMQSNKSFNQPHREVKSYNSCWSWPEYAQWGQTLISHHIFLFILYLVTPPWFSFCSLLKAWRVYNMMFVITLGFYLYIRENFKHCYGEEKWLSPLFQGES